jgi:Ca2+-transporting ATPase
MKNMGYKEEDVQLSLKGNNQLKNQAIYNHLDVDKAAEMTVEQVVETYETDLQLGLSEEQAASRLKQVGPNEIEDEEKESLLSKYIDQFKEPMILLLLGSAAVSLLVKQYDDAISIAAAVLIVVTVAFVQEYRSDKALEALKKLTYHTASVFRNGELKRVNAADLVPGDVVKFEVGDRIPADIRICESVLLSIDESLFTGEVNPVFKEIHETKVLHHGTVTTPNGDENSFPKATHVADCKNIAFMGTLVAGGSGKGVVIATGIETELGKISTILKQMDENKTPLQESMEKLSQQISILSFGIIAVIFLIGVFTGKPWLEMFTMGISLAVAAIPEGLPIVVTVTLAMGVMRMAQKKVIIRKLPSVESLGACNVICVDKTGTLTANQMTVKKIFTYADRESIIDVTGLGYQYDNGSFFRYSRAYGSKSSTLYDKGEPIYPRNEDHLKMLMLIGLLCNNATLRRNPDDNKVRVLGSPTEGALLTLAEKAGLNRDELNANWEREKEIPFSSDHKWMAVRCRNKITGKRQYFIKGAIENIIGNCTTYYVNSRDSAVPLTPNDRININNAASEFANNALRVMALATADDIDGRFTFVGIVGIYDPPREGVKEAIAKLLDAGVKVVMITGDSKDTAVAIGRELGIIPARYEMEPDSGIALSVEDLRDVDPETFKQLVDKAYIFYRMIPVHKMKIVEAYKSLNYVVAMTGDGFNDALSLKCASIGIAMGESGTDSSKEASEMILADDNFSTIMAAIEEGKSIFNNIKNFLRYQLSTSVSCMMIIIICTLFNMPLPLNPMQILWVNIIMDGPPAQSLGVEPVDEDVMKQPPRDPKKPIITPRMLFNIISSAIIMVIGTLYVFVHEMEDGKVTRRCGTMTFTTFVLFQVFNALNCRNEKKSVFQIGFFTNKAFLFAVGGSMLGQLLLIYWKWLEFVFETESLSLHDMAFIFAITSTVWIFDEIVKFIIRTREDKSHLIALHDDHNKSM